MADVLLMLKRQSISDGLINILNSNGIADVIIETDYNNLLNKSRECSPKVILLEVPESGFPNIYTCLEIADKIKEKASLSKILLMCFEKDDNAVKLSIEAKRSKRVDDFIFYDATAHFLYASLKSLM